MPELYVESKNGNISGPTILTNSPAQAASNNLCKSTFAYDTCVTWGMQNNQFLPILPMNFQDLGYQVVLEQTFFEQKLHMAEHL